MSDLYYEETEEERRARRRARLEEMKREKKKTEILHKVIVITSLIMVVVLVVGLGILIHSIVEKVGEGKKQAEQTIAPTGQEFVAGNITQEILQGMEAENGLAQEQMLQAPGQLTGDSGQSSAGANQSTATQQTMAQTYAPVFHAEQTEATTGLVEAVNSTYGIILDVEKGTILAAKEPVTRMSPASMTKVLTILTAANALGISGEEGKDNPVLDEKVKVTIQVTDYCYQNECSVVGYSVDEETTIRDLFYGTILPSGADAALTLANYVAGSQEAFVDLMNEELKKMDMEETSHFTNCIGLYDKEHYSTVYDIGVMLKMAADNPFCREVLSAHTYTTTPSEAHPEGMLISNWFLRRIEDKDTHGEVLCGKTGFVAQSKSCAASLGTDREGREYICVTAGAYSSWRCIYDHVALYQEWLP